MNLIEYLHSQNGRFKCNKQKYKLLVGCYFIELKNGYRMIHKRSRVINTLNKVVHKYKQKMHQGAERSNFFILKV